MSKLVAVLALVAITCACRRDSASAPRTVPPGFYDDFDPAIVYRGDWQHDKGFQEPDRHTVSYADTAGAESSISFEGKAVTYVYTKAPNRGQAAVTIDGEDKGPIDLYSGRIEWQTKTRYCCFGAGRHVIVIRVTGQANPESRGRFVDVDSFVVE